jgi:Outer membrane protein beta-barrel domain
MPALFGMYIGISGYNLKIIIMKMKMIGFLAIALLTAQFSFAQGFKFGVKGGVNIGKVDGKAFKQEFRYGYHAGVFAEIKVNKKWSIQPEVLWNQSNTSSANKLDTLYTTLLNTNNFKNIKLNYLSIPVLLNYKVSNFLTLQAGPQFGILVNQNRNLLQNGGDAFKKGDLSLLGGVQLKVLGVRLSGRYAIGLNDINDVTAQDKWKSQGFQLAVGFTL